MLYKKYLLLFLLALLISCASIPNATSTLTKDVINNGDNMHQLNVSLINKLFNERKERLNSFITNTYTPAIIEKYQKLLPTTIDYKKELPNIIKSIIPVINRKKDSLQGLLDNQKEKIISTLNTSFISYTKASASLQNLIDSAVKLKNAEKNALSSINNLTGNKLDFKKIENSFNSLLNKVGGNMEELLKIEKDLNFKQKQRHE